MRSQALQNYYNATASRPIRSDLKLAVEHVDGPRIAIDCGCGAGSDIAYLRAQGFRVYGFDIEAVAIARCQSRFADDDRVVLSQDTFGHYAYPQASLILADASLFFCSREEFVTSWQKITQALLPRGLFVGSFLGMDDTMAHTQDETIRLWPEVLVANEGMVRSWFKAFHIISLTEHRTSGTAPGGGDHHWHIFSVVAQKLPHIPVRSTSAG